MHRGRVSDSSAARRAVKLDAFVEHVDKRQLYKVHKGICGICGGTVKFKSMTIDHITPLSKGGMHCYDNTQPAHSLCNHIKGNNEDGEFDLHAEIARIRTKRASKKYRNVTGRANGVRQGLVHAT